MLARALLADPALRLVASAALALLFASAALHKLRDSRRFVAVVRNYRLLPAAVAPAFAVAIPVFEVGAAIGLAAVAVAPGSIAGAVARAAAFAALALLGLYSLAIGANLARGRRSLDCGCTGPRARQPIAPWMLARNAFVALPAAALAFGPEAAARALGWVDLASCAFALVAFALVWQALHALAAQSVAVRATPRLEGEA